MDKRAEYSTAPPQLVKGQVHGTPTSSIVTRSYRGRVTGMPSSLNQSAAQCWWVSFRSWITKCRLRPSLGSVLIPVETVFAHEAWNTTTGACRHQSHSDIADCPASPLHWTCRCFAELDDHQGLVHRHLQTSHSQTVTRRTSGLSAARVAHAAVS